MDDFQKQLAEFVAFQSVSTDSAHQLDIEHTVEWLRGKFLENGFSVDVREGLGHPIIIAENVIDPGAETCLVYGHYDVQPARISDGWDSDPFELVLRKGKLYGRGVVDNKGQVFTHIYTVFQLLREKNLEYNTVFVIEGDEESGGNGVGVLLRERQGSLKADHVLISDGEMPYRPVLTASFRGTLNLRVVYRTMDNNLHSGLYGGAVPNAAEELAKLIAGLHDENNDVVIDDFYKEDRKVTKKTKDLCVSMDVVRQKVLEGTGAKQLFTGRNKSFSARVGFESMLSVSGMTSGYVGEGYSNIIPCTAEARINLRLAADQDPEKALSRFRKYVKEHTPDYVSWDIQDVEAETGPVQVLLDSRKHKEVMKLLEEVYGEKVLVDFCGATLPVVADFQQVLGVGPLLVSLANDDCNMHGVNENFDLELLQKGLTFSRRFFGKKS